MTIVTKRDRIGASRGKLALMGVLAVVLVVVIVGQMPGSTDADVPTATAVDMPGYEGSEAKKVVATPAPQPAAAAAAPVNQPPRNWPELPMETILAHDPLAAPPWYLAALNPEENGQLADGPSPAGDAAESLILAKMQEAGATIVLIANGQRIATIGDRQIRIGDRIEGYLVSDITDQGVILTKSRSR